MESSVIVEKMKTSKFCFAVNFARTWKWDMGGYSIYCVRWALQRLYRDFSIYLFIFYSSLW